MNKLTRICSALSLCLTFTIPASAQNIIEDNSEWCAGDHLDRGKARQWSKNRGYAVTSNESKCSPTSITNMDIELGANVDPDSGETRDPDELQDALTKCLKEEGFINSNGSCNLYQIESNAKKICACNKKVTGKDFECRGINFDYAQSTWSDVQDSLEDGCGVICMGSIRPSGGGHVMTITGVDDDSVTILEPNGGEYDVARSGESQNVGNPSDPLIKRMNKGKKVKGAHIAIYNCITKCHAKTANYFQPDRWLEYDLAELFHTE